MSEKKTNITAAGAKPGEDDIIEMVRRELGPPGARVLIGIGDDAAALAPPAEGAATLLTTDMMVEGTHFRFDWASPYQAGWKAIVAAASDIGAMGGRPTAAVVSIGLTGNEKQTTIRDLTRGMKAAAKKYAFDIVGGDTVRSKAGIVISVSVLGEVLRDKIIRRKGARPGDAIIICGEVGASAAGLEVLRKKSKAEMNATEKRVVEKHLAPEILIDAGRIAAASGAVTAMMDLSDGLSADLPRLCARSGVGAVIRELDLPIHPDTARVCHALGIDAVETAIAGGEDYSLLITADATRAGELARTLAATAQCPTAIIGEITERVEGIHLITEQGKTVPWPDKGFRHF